MHPQSALMYSVLKPFEIRSALTFNLDTRLLLQTLSDSPEACKDKSKAALNANVIAWLMGKTPPLRNVSLALSGFSPPSTVPS